MPHVNSFSILHCISSLVAIPLLQLHIKKIKAGRRRMYKKPCCVKPEAKDTDITAERGETFR